MNNSQIINLLQELLEQEEIYMMYLTDEAEGVDSDRTKATVQGIELYYNRIKERIQKEIIDVYSNPDNTSESEHH